MVLWVQMLALRWTRYNSLFWTGLTQSVLDQQVDRQKMTSQTKPDTPIKHLYKGSGAALETTMCLYPSVADSTVLFHSFISLRGVGLLQQLAQPYQDFCPRGKG